MSFSRPKSYSMTKFSSSAEQKYNRLGHLILPHETSCEVDGITLFTSEAGKSCTTASATPEEHVLPVGHRGDNKGRLGDN